LPPFYIGSTSVERIAEGYHGSVNSKKYAKIWAKEIRKNSKAFKTHVLSAHSTREEALAKEEKLQRLLNVVRNTLYVNQAYANKGFLNLGPHSEETKQKIREKKTGVIIGPRSQETKQKQSVASLGRKKSRQHCLAMSIGQTGRVQSSEMVEKRRAKLTGQKRSAEVCAAISSALKNPSEKIRENFRVAQRLRHINTEVELKTPSGEILHGNSLEDMCIEHNLYTTSMLRTLRAGKPIMRGVNAGWQLLKIKK
jgi:hypothetical protein